MSLSRACDITASTILVGLLAIGTLGTAQAQSAAESDFYHGRTITLEVGYSAGSAYDLLGRVLARHYGEHIPGHPAIIVTNQPGAGSLMTANRMSNAMKRDGTEIGTFGRSILMEPLLGNKLAIFDPAKLSWIGNVADETSVCVSWYGSKIKAWDDFFTNTFVVAASSPGSDTGVFANVIKDVFGAKINMIVGYPGGAEITQAIESGEVDGRCGWSWSALKSSKPEWITEKRINLLIQLGMTSNPQLRGVPVLIDLATSQKQRDIVAMILRRQEIAWPFAAPPGIPSDRLKILRDAFMETMRDDGFIADALKLGIEVNPKSGPEVEAIVRSIYQSSPDVVEKVRELLNP